jgi:hypothetical protein
MFTKWHTICEPLGSLDAEILGNREFLAGTNLCLLPPRRDASRLLSVSITMVDDGTQHHEHLSPASPFKPSSVTIFIENVQSAHVGNNY